MAGDSLDSIIVKLLIAADSVPGQHARDLKDLVARLSKAATAERESSAKTISQLKANKAPPLRSANCEAAAAEILRLKAVNEGLQAEVQQLQASDAKFRAGDQLPESHNARVGTMDSVGSHAQDAVKPQGDDDELAMVRDLMSSFTDRHC